MTLDDVIKQLEELIDDRKSFITDYSDEDSFVTVDSGQDIYHKDVEALEYAVKVLKKRGHWKTVSANLKSCSACKHTIPIYKAEIYNYCPSCGIYIGGDIR